MVLYIYKSALSDVAGKFKERCIVKVAVVDKDYCVACGSCIYACPKKAVEVFKGKHAVVDEVLCIGCGKCSKICPASVISMEVAEIG